MFLPMDQYLVLASGDASAKINVMIDHGGDALFINQGPPGIHLLLGICESDTPGDRMMRPV